MRRWSAIALLLLVVVGCGRGRDRDTLYVSLDADPTTFDPALIQDVAGGEIAAKLFNGLVRYDQQGRLIPDLAERYEVSADGCTFTFHLRRGVRFASGDPVTAEDVKFSLERLLRPATHAPRPWVLEKVVGYDAFRRGELEELPGVRVVDTHTVTITLDEPFAPFLSRLTLPGGSILPRAEVERLGEEFASRPVGSGPFILERYKPSESLTLKANPDYFDGPPTIARMVYRIVREPMPRVAEFRRGALDVISIPQARLDQFQTDPELKRLVIGEPGLNTYFLGFNCTRPPFDDVRVRRALSHAVDRQSLIQTILKDRAVIAAGPIPPGLAGYDPELKGYEYDPAEAKRLLQEAGWDWNREMEIILPSAKETIDLINAVADCFTRLGVKVRVSPRERSTFKMLLRQGDFDLYYYSWWADYMDAENFLAPLFLSAPDRAAGNATGYANPQVDRHIRAAQREMDEAERVGLYQEIQRLVVADAPRIFLWHRKLFIAVQPWVRNYGLYPLYNVNKGDIVSLDWTNVR